MKFLADENLPFSIIKHLKKNHFDIKSCSKGTSDKIIIKTAHKEKRVILTFDKDFLTFKNLEEKFSAIVLHFPEQRPEVAIFYLQALLPKIIKLKKGFIFLLSKKTLEKIR